MRIHNAHIMEAYDRIKMGSRGDHGSNPDIERMTLYERRMNDMIDFMNVDMHLFRC